MDDWKQRMEEERKHFDAEWAKSKALPEGLQVGKLFRTQVADGYAYYEVVKINKRTVRIKWREDLCADKWQDQILGAGGSFATNVIEPLILREEALDRIFSKQKAKA